MGTLINCLIIFDFLFHFLIISFFGNIFNGALNAFFYVIFLIFYILIWILFNTLLRIKVDFVIFINDINIFLQSPIEFFSQKNWNINLFTDFFILRWNFILINYILGCIWYRVLRVFEAWFTRTCVENRWFFFYFFQINRNKFNIF